MIKVVPLRVDTSASVSACLIEASALITVAGGRNAESVSTIHSWKDSEDPIERKRYQHYMGSDPMFRGQMEDNLAAGKPVGEGLPGGFMRNYYL
jgi:hypothetical protein